MAVIGIDFDGTCVENKFPEIGNELPNCVNVLKKCLQNDNKLILITMRSEKSLIDAIKWFKDRKIELWGINNNPTQKKWTTSRKIYANIYIDDLNLGCPLKNKNVDFVASVPSDIGKMLEKKGLYKLNIGKEYNFRGEEMVKNLYFTNKELVEKVFKKPAENVTEQEVREYDKFYNYWSFI